MKDSNNRISKRYLPLVRYAHDIAKKLLLTIHEIERGVHIDRGEPSDLVVLGENVHNQYTLFGERQLIIEPTSVNGPIFEDRFTADKYMMTGILEKGDLEEYVNIGKRKMPKFFNGQTASGSGRNHVTGFITVFTRYGDHIAENFLPVDLYETAERFARANDRWFDVHPSDLLRYKKTLIPKRVDDKVTILWPSDRKKK